MAEKWAQHCAKLEKGSAGFIFEATQEYAARAAEGWSQRAIAEEVTAAGFPISEATVQRRIKALAEVEGSVGPKETEFFAAYQRLNDAGSHSGERGGRLPQNEEGVAMVLEKAAKELQDKYDWTETEVKQEIAAAKVKAEPAAAVKKTKVDHNYDILDHVAEELDDLEPPFSRRAQAKYDQVFLKFQVVGEEMTV